MPDDEPAAEPAPETVMLMEATADQLLAEIERRYDAFVFCARRPAEGAGDGEARRWTAKLVGDSDRVLGLAHRVQMIAASWVGQEVREALAGQDGPADDDDE